jgi:hypothetical protein
VARDSVQGAKKWLLCCHERNFLACSWLLTVSPHVVPALGRAHPGEDLGSFTFGQLKTSRKGVQNGVAKHWHFPIVRSVESSKSIAETCATISRRSMASISLRSSRRTGGLATRSSTRNNVALRPGSRNSDKYAHTTQQLANIGRKKRPRDPTDKEEQIIKAKRAKIAVEILPPPKAQPKTRSLVLKSKANANSDVPPQRAAPPLQKATPTARKQQQPPPEAGPPPQKPTNHHEKVANGIKNEIERLQPNIADLKDERRKLRSQEGTRFKSELSQYFPEYDEVIGNEPKEDRKRRVLSEIGYMANLI